MEYSYTLCQVTSPLMTLNGLQNDFNVSICCVHIYNIGYTKVLKLSNNKNHSLCYMKYLF